MRILMVNQIISIALPANLMATFSCTACQAEIYMARYLLAPRFYLSLNGETL